VHAVTRTTRVGLSQGRDLPFRHFLSDSPHVSPGKPSLPGSESATNERPDTEKLYNAAPATFKGRAPR
jgi:3-methyladenine DNA glycosylase Mpg